MCFLLPAGRTRRKARFRFRMRCAASPSAPWWRPNRPRQARICWTISRCIRSRTSSARAICFEPRRPVTLSPLALRSPKPLGRAAMKKTVAAVLFLSCGLAGAAWAQGGDAGAGKTLWEGNGTMCRNCHGKDGEGGFGPDLAGRGLSFSEFKQAVRKPWGVMPAFTEGQLSDSDLANLAAYFASLPKKPDVGPWRFTANAAMPHGQQVFHDV